MLSGLCVCASEKERESNREKEREREREREILLECVDNEWKVKKDASRSRSVWPIGILYIGYLHPNSKS